MVNKIIEDLENNSDIKVVSFDIFDTLLFRTVTEPEQVFVRMYKLYPDKFPDFTNEEDWKQARKNAAIQARKNKKKLNKTTEQVKV